MSCWVCKKHIQKPSAHVKETSPTFRQSSQRDKTPQCRIRSKGKGYTCRVGVSRKFGACAYVRCAPARRYIYIQHVYYVEKSCQSYIRLYRLARSRSPIIAKGKGYKCRVGVSSKFRACAYIRRAPAPRDII